MPTDYSEAGREGAQCARHAAVLRPACVKAVSHIQAVLWEQRPYFATTCAAVGRGAWVVS